MAAVRNARDLSGEGGCKVTAFARESVRGVRKTIYQGISLTMCEMVADSYSSSRRPRAVALAQIAAARRMTSGAAGLQAWAWS